MAAISKDFQITGRLLGPGLIWANLDIPTAGARMSVAQDSDGFWCPDNTAGINANAVCIGATKGAITCSAKASRQDFFADQIPGAVDSKVTQVDAMIKADVYGLSAAAVVKLAMAGFGTQASSSGYVQNTLGYLADTFSCIALLAPRRDDTTKCFIFMLYKAICTSGVEFAIGKDDLAASNVEFRGYSITTRAAADQIGNYWWTTS